MTTVNEALTNAVGDLVTKVVFPSLVDFLAKEKNVTCTVDELCNVLKLPVTSTPTTFTSHPPMAIPKSLSGSSLSSNGVGSISAPKKRGAGKAADSADVVRCNYKMTRGKNEGQLCGKPVREPGQERCKTCATKGGGKDKADGTSKNALGETKGSLAPMNPGSASINVVPILGTTDHFRDTRYSIVIRKLGEDSFTALGVMLDTTKPNERRPLHREEYEWAESQGIQVNDEFKAPAQTAPVATQVTPTVLPVGGGKFDINALIQKTRATIQAQ